MTSSSGAPHNRPAPMTPLRALGMPFQVTGLLFVAITALISGFALGSALGSPPGTPAWVISILVSLLMLVWITRYAFHLLDAAANGVTETPVASVEMLSLLGDARCWVHPLLATALGVFLSLSPNVPRLPFALGALALFPASIAAMTMSGRAVDALNPYALARAVGGLAHYYLLVLLLDLACIVLVVLLFRAGLSNSLGIAAAEFLLLMTYSFTGGALHARRNELQFAPRVAPEREQAREDAEHARRRQAVIDGIYRDLRVRESVRAVTSASSWLTASAPHELHANIQTLLESAGRWNEPRELPKLLRGLIPTLLDIRQPALACQILEAGLVADQKFTPAAEAETLALVRYVLHTGRKRLAQTLLDNYLAASPTAPAEQLLALKAELAQRQKA